MKIDAWTLWFVGMAIWTAVCLSVAMYFASRTARATTSAKDAAAEPPAAEPVYRFRL